MLSTFGVHNAANARAHKITSVSQVDPVGGDVATVTVTNSSNVREVRIGGTSCSFFPMTTTKLAVITPTKQAGIESVQVKYRTGVVARSSITYWSPVDTNTTLCMERGGYISGEWKDRSGNARHFTDASSYPTDIDKEPQFNEGATTQLLSRAISWNAIMSADLINYSVSMMIRVRALPPNNATVYQNTAALTDAGAYGGLFLSDTRVVWRHHDGVLSNEVEISTPLSLFDWHVVDVECNAGSLRMRIDGGSWTSPITVPAIGSTAFNLRVGNNHGTTVPFVGDMRGLVFSNIARGNTWFNNCSTWWSVRHGYRTGSAPSIASVDSDVFDPSGGDVAFIKGANLSSTTDVKFGSTSCLGKPALTSHPSFDGANDVLQLAYSRSTILGNSGWTYTGLIDCVGLTADPQHLLMENQAYVYISIYKGGASVHQYNAAGNILSSAYAGGVGNGLHVIQARWTGTQIQVRVDGGAWASIAQTEIGGSSNFKIGSNYIQTAGFLKGRIVEMFTTDSSLSDLQLDSVIGGMNYDYGLRIGGIAAASYSRAQLSLTTCFKPGSFSAGTWTGTASAGSSSSRNLSEATNPPSSVTSSLITVKAFGSLPDFDGANDELSTAVTLNNVFGNGAMSGWVLIDVDKVVGGAGAGSAYTNDIVFGTEPNAYFVVTLKNDGHGQIRAYPSSGVPLEIDVDLHGGWNLLQWRCDGTDIYFRSNGDDWTTAAFTGVDSSGNASTFALGAIGSYSTNELNGRMAEIATAIGDIGQKGSDNVLAYVNQRYGLNLGGYAPFDFDPTTLSLSLFCRAGDYAVGTWTGTASAGSSGGRNLTEATNPPTVASNEITCRVPALSAGATMAGVPRFDGTNDSLGGPGEVAPTIEDVFGISGGASAAGSYTILFRADSAQSANAQVYSNPGLLSQVGGNSAGNGCSFSSAGVKFGHYDGTWDQITIAADVGEWHVAQAKWNGTTLYARVLTHGQPPGAWQSLARGTWQTTAGGYLDLGGQYDSLRWFHGVIAEVMTAASVLSDAEMDNIVRYLNNRHGMRLGMHAVSSYDPAVLALTTWYRSGGYTAGTWTGVASAGASGSRNLGEATNANMPIASSEIVPARLPVTIITPAGEATVTDVVRYANPGTIPSNVWWMHAQSGIVTEIDGTVKSWADQSGAGDAGRNMAPTSDYVPYRYSSAYNGKMIIDNQYAGTNRLLRANAAWSTTFHTFTLSTIGHGKTTGNTYYVFEDNSMYNTIITQGGTPGMYNLGASELINGTGNFNQPGSIAVAVFNGATSNFYVEDNVATSGAFTNTHVLGGFRGYAGSYLSNTSTYGVWGLADVAAYSRVLTADEARTLRRYRDSYYGKVVT